MRYRWRWWWWVIMDSIDWRGHNVIERKFSSALKKQQKIATFRWCLARDRREKNRLRALHETLITINYFLMRITWEHTWAYWQHHQTIVICLFLIHLALLSLPVGCRYTSAILITRLSALTTNLEFHSKSGFIWWLKMVTLKSFLSTYISINSFCHFQSVGRETFKKINSEYRSSLILLNSIF